VKEVLAGLIAQGGDEPIDVEEWTRIVLYDLRERNGLNLRALRQHQAAVAVTTMREVAARAGVSVKTVSRVFNDDPHEQSSHIEKLFWGPSSVILDPQERLYVTETHRHRLQVYQRGD